MWAECPGTAGTPFPADLKPSTVLGRDPLWESAPLPDKPSTYTWRLKLFALAGVPRPAAGG